MDRQRQNESVAKALFGLPVVVAALGYFVDIYDLVLFGIVRVESLKSLGLEGEAITRSGAFLLNMQMVGMLLGGIMWGILGDKKGRLSVLFGSIVLYSIANFLNGFVNSFEAYAALRFLAGIGLAGELGAGVTLVSEILPKEQRGYATMMIAGTGVTGAVLANLIAGQFDWRMAYIIGGILGFLLLLLRVGTFESEMFRGIRKEGVKRGNFIRLFTDRTLFAKYIRSIAIGIPLWFVVGILIVFSPEFAKALGIKGEVKAGDAVMYTYIGLAIGDFLSGYLSQRLKSRKKVVALFLALSAIGVIGYLSLGGSQNTTLYAMAFYLGVVCGYWALFITIAAEQFGTNIRATVATTVPNFVRGMVVPLTSLFLLLKEPLGTIKSAAAIALVCFVLALWALLLIEETFNKDLDYLET